MTFPQEMTFSWDKTSFPKNQDGTGQPKSEWGHHFPKIRTKMSFPKNDVSKNQARTGHDSRNPEIKKIEKIFC